jgi:hypothetical protein
MSNADTILHIQTNVSNYWQVAEDYELSAKHTVAAYEKYLYYLKAKIVHYDGV